MRKSIAWPGMAGRPDTAAKAASDAVVKLRFVVDPLRLARAPACT